MNHAVAYSFPNNYLVFYRNELVVIFFLMSRTYPLPNLFDFTNNVVRLS